MAILPTRGIVNLSTELGQAQSQGSTDQGTEQKSNFPSLNELITYLNGHSIPALGHRNPGNRFRNIKFNDRGLLSGVTL